MLRVPSYAPVEYVLKRERELPREQQTVFRIRQLSYAGKEAVADVTASRPESNVFEVARVTLNTTLVGWSNVTRGDGAELAFPSIADGPSRTIPNEVLDVLGDDAVELSNEVWRISSLAEDAQKKS